MYLETKTIAREGRVIHIKHGVPEFFTPQMKIINDPKLEKKEVH